MVRGLVDKGLEELFHFLDSDHDGVISALRVCIDGLPKARLSILAPLLAEVEEKKVSLDLASFKHAAHRLLATLNVEEKRVLLGLDCKKKSCVEDMLNLPFKVPLAHLADSRAKNQPDPHAQVYPVARKNPDPQAKAPAGTPDSPSKCAPRSKSGSRKNSKSALLCPKSSRPASRARRPLQAPAPTRRPALTAIFRVA